MQYGVLRSLKALLRGIFHGSSDLTSGRVKNQYHCVWLVFPQGVKLLFQCTELKMKLCFNLCFQLPLLDTSCVTKLTASPAAILGLHSRSVMLERKQATVTGNSYYKIEQIINEQKIIEQMVKQLILQCNKNNTNR